MRNLAIVGALLVVIAAGIVWGLNYARRYLDPFRVMQAGITQTSTPLSRSAALADCPIPLPESATNIQYVAWSEWQASQTFVRFEAPVADCLEHAQRVLQPHIG